MSLHKPKEIKADGKKVLFFFEAGKRVAVEVGDTKISKDFFDLMSNTSKSQFDFLLNTAEILNGLFQSSIVHAPRFMIGTMVRDNMTRSFIPRYMGMLGRVPPVQDITGLYTLLFNRSFADTLASGGLIKGGVVSHAVRDFSSGDLTHSMKGMTAKNWREAPRAFLWNTTLDRLNAADGNPLKIAKALTFDTVWSAVKSGIGLIESGETISRVGVARLTYKYLKKQGLTDEEALRGAIFEANDMLDYSRKGSATNAATKLVPFLNPGIQGVDRSLRSSIAEPLKAIAKMRDRGGYANLDAKDKNAITAWAKNLMMFSLYAGAWLTYRETIKKEPFYEQASEQRKKDYMLFPLGEDKYGTPVGVTLRKALDWPGAVLNMMENFIDELEESDPINWDKISHSLKEGIIPRQFQSFDALLSASPIPKTAYEVALNTKFGPPGTTPQPIVPPEIAEKGSPAEQFSNYTSDIAKFIGRELNVSPMVVDHVIRSAGTSAQDITDLSTAVVGDNPIVTPSEALSRFFFGAIYRQQRGAPAYRADMQDLVAKDHGTYQIQANAYLSALKDGDEFKAEQVYNRADDGAKTFMLIQSSSNFSSEIQQLHPLEHSQAVARVMHGLMSRLPEKLVEIHSERYEKGAAHKVIKIDRDQAKLLDTQFNMIVAEETRNGLAIMKQPGYDSFEVKDTTPRLEIIRHISPEVADEVEAVLAKAHILPATAIKAVWPEVKDRLLKDKSSAYLGDLQLKAKFGAELMPRMLVQ